LALPNDRLILVKLREGEFLPKRDGLYKRVTDFIQEVWNEQNNEALTRYLHPELVQYGLVENEPEGLNFDQYASLRKNFLAAFPDAKFSIEHLMVEGNRIAVRYKIAGTHTGNGFGWTPSNRKIRLTAMAIAVWKGDRMIEVWNNFDHLAMMRQIGMSR
jgi:predicted ester cyclase